MEKTNGRTLPVPLSPSQQNVYNRLHNLLPKSRLLGLACKSGCGRTTILQNLAETLDAHYLRPADVFEQMEQLHPQQLQEGILRTFLKAFEGKNRVILDDFHVVSSILSSCYMSARPNVLGIALDEVLRLYPPAWSFERQATAPDVIGGYAVDRGAIVAVCPYVLHRHPLYWDNPEGFDPERFTPERSAGRPRYAYVPFGAGPRTCIGNHFAMMEAQIILAMVAREYRLDLVSAHDVVLDPVITLRPKTGIKVERRRWGCPAPRTPSGSRSAARAGAPRSD